MRLLRHLGIEVILDVGANVGQFGAEVRDHGYSGRILSFEPLAAPFQALARTASRDASWQVFQFAIGLVDGPARMHVAANQGASSSLLESTQLNDRAAPEARYVGSEDVQVRRLDGLAKELLVGFAPTLLKVDVQGAERQVLDGATETMSTLSAVQLELSLYPLYVGAPSYDDLIHVMEHHGFDLAGIEPGLADRTNGRLLQVDALFVRADEVQGNQIRPISRA